MAVTLLALAMPAYASTGGRVLIDIDGTASFDVLHSRAMSTATGAALFGLIGAGIEEGSRKSSDENLEAELEPHLTDLDCRTAFVGGLVSRLEEKGFETVVAESGTRRRDAYDYVIRIKLRNCGFKMTNTQNREMAAFYYAQYGIEKGDEKASKLGDLLMTGRTLGSWTEMMSDTERCESEFVKVRQKAGRRIANKLIYRKKD